MSRSIHQTRKSSKKEYLQGNIEPMLEYSLKSDLKNISSELRKEFAINAKMVNEEGVPNVIGKSKTVRNANILSTLKKFKKKVKGRK
jgi:hypothetical protein